MYSKIMRNDMRKGKLITITITGFILAAAMLTSLAAMLIVNLFGAIDNIVIDAKSPDFVQMHTGAIDRQELDRFAKEHENVQDYQILEFLNVDGEDIATPGNSLGGSIQDNGIATQSENFDYLLGMNNEKIVPQDGEIYMPVYYMKEIDIQVGDSVTIYDQQYKVAGFMRDSIMNPGLSSSKRLLVSDRDFEKIRDLGMMEHLIEFRLKDASAADSFESEYLLAKLPANGPPAITHSLVRLMNGMTDGIMIGVLVLISILVIIVTFLCIRFTLLAKVEEDYREIGVLKAVGLRVGAIKKLYAVKYGVIAGFACLLGFLVALLVQDPFMENIRLYMGEPDQMLLGSLLGLVGAAIIFFVVMLYVNGVLRRFRKISPAQAVRFGAPKEKSKATKSFQLNKNRMFSSNAFLGIKDVLSRKRLYMTMLMVLIISTFIMIVPQNIHNTISSKSFVTYMGMGNCDMQVGVMRTQVSDVAEKTARVEEVLALDKDVSKYTVITSMMFDLRKEDGTMKQFKVSLGDHNVFPVTYSKGREVRRENEIAISTLNAEELEKTIGEEITLIIDGGERHLTICGLYSDVTNGGKTAKAIFKPEQKDVLGTMLLASFHEESMTNEKVSLYRETFPFTKAYGINDTINQTIGSTLTAVQKASYAAIGAAILLTLLITVLFIKMLVTRDRYSIAVLKSLGFTSSAIRRQYLIRSVVILILGISIGTILANTLGELVGVAIISAFGASTFNFVINPYFAYLLAPLLIAVCVYTATRLGLSDIRSLKVSKHIKEV